MGIMLSSFKRLFSRSEPVLKITPLHPNVLDLLHLKVTGLLPNEKIKIVASLTDQINRTWLSHAIFLGDGKGCVDLSSQAPIGGTYSGVDAMGLFWSMYLQNTTDTRAFLHSTLEPIITVFYVERADGTRCCETRIERTVTQHKIRKIDIKEQDIVGYLCLPAGEGPFPGIIILGGSRGGLPAPSFVAQFADRGYVALGLAYFNAPGLPEHFVNIPLEYFEKAIYWMTQQKEVAGQQLSILGQSMGGTAALLVGAHFPEIRSVISICGRGIHFQSTYYHGFEQKPQPVFCYREKPLAFLPVEVPPPTEENEKTAYFLRIFLGALFKASAEMIEQASIRVEKINGPILLFATLDDALAGSPFLSGLSYDRLVNHHFSHPFDLIVYNGCGHLIYGLPYTPTTAQDSPGIPHPLTRPFHLGGIPSCMMRAQVDVWQRIFEFLHTNTINN
ncbi:MAG: acyl-CoA thioester hydrolase/BAAT C-terminal domain-containing protein [Chlamydiales bacterium]